MNRRGFFGTLAALIGATIVGRPRDPGPEALHLRFDHHGPATKIRWTQEGAYIQTSPPKLKKIDMTCYYDDWRPKAGSAFVLLKEKP